MNIFIILAFLCTSNFAFSDAAPFNFETVKRFKKVEVKNTMRFLLNNASLFPSGDTLSLTDQFGAQAVLPAGSDVLHAYYYVKTAFSTSSQTKAQIGITCGSATLLTAADESGVASGGMFDGNPPYNNTYAGSGGSAYVGSSNCIITATQTVGIFSGGKIYGYVEYVNVLP